MVRCKFCDSESVVKKGFVLGKQFYECKSCNHRFVDNGSFAGMRTKSNVIASGISLYYDGCSLRKCQKQIAEIWGVKVSQVTVLNWIRKYSGFVEKFVETLTPQLSGKYHHDETVVKIRGHDKWFWEMIDEDTRFLVASHLSDTRTFEDTVIQFRKSMEIGKARPQAIFVDGSQVYNSAFNRVFYSRYKVNKVELVQRVGIRARETNNVVERLHGNLKDRLRPMRGLKEKESSRQLLKGYVVNYNFVKPHSKLKGKTPAQVAGLDSNLNNWFSLIKTATTHRIAEEKRNVISIEVEV